MLNVHEAKTRLSELLRRVEQGEEFVIGRNGDPVARLVAVNVKPRNPGRWRGRVRVADDFDETPEDLISLFEQ